MGIYNHTEIRLLMNVATPVPTRIRVPVNIQMNQLTFLKSHYHSSISGNYFHLSGAAFHCWK